MQKQGEINDKLQRVTQLWKKQFTYALVTSTTENCRVFSNFAQGKYLT